MPLLSTKTIVPGGWRFIQYLPDGSEFKRFKSMGPYDTFVSEIASLRTANQLSGADWNTVDVEVQAFTCTRLGNDPRYCGTPGQPSVTSTTASPVSGGGGCGGCGGSKA